MRDSVRKYTELFEKTLNLSGICWWIIDFKENPDYYFCNELMKETFSLDKNLELHSIEDTCPIAGDYYKNIELACEINENARIIIDEYKQLINQEIDEYNNKFPYYNAKFNKTFYFSSRAKVLETTTTNEVAILYGIIEDITTQELHRHEMEELSIRDKLTNLYNRVKTDESIKYEIKRSIRYKFNLSLILIDIDFFKLVNDNYGHLTGDAVLVQTAKLLKENVRDSDIVGRWGGEEFIIICPNSEKASAKILADKLRKLIENFDFDVVKHKTASFGLTQFNNNDTLETLIDRADKALYKAKESGRNRVQVL
ncbi:MAG: diguanylate cyclase (GGDEF)-like protein [Sulfurimonas sp.]|jgi:diguanylate cyclase (GGDEF)-like protein|uniref:GGDEF domain-containing protein n=1 Tax=Sulfurimonas sp. TaxID=2022749 RepID=UPI0039E2A2C5